MPPTTGHPHGTGQVSSSADQRQPRLPTAVAVVTAMTAPSPAKTSHLLQRKSQTAGDFSFGGAIHVDDLGSIWEYLGQTLPYADDQLELSHQMISYWGQFAASGSPNGPRTPNWPTYDPKSGALMSLKACDSDPATNRAPAACSKVSTGFAAEHDLAFWAGLPTT
ncbi:carboxylesterase family protein [Streptomyces fuscichromogenes]|uniref:carboxylesterase family protein n=1 Tax=Streptomyces fuscichromogenes TaxID=1324013 RepID=UPI001E346F59|nr:carboxylesterase family protein [Streptomyces fuscichromogenes]